MQTNIWHEFVADFYSLPFEELVQHVALVERGAQQGEEVRPDIFVRRKIKKGRRKGTGSGFFNFYFRSQNSTKLHMLHNISKNIYRFT